MAIQTDPNPSSLKIPDKDGKPPEERIRNVHQVWEICNELDKQDSKRSKKRARIFRAYNRFPPSDYSTLWKKGQSWQSNVNFGMLSYVVDNNLSSFFDMITERPMVADIKTKKGKPKERVEWSDKISAAFDKVFREWDEFLTNVEEDVLEMLLYGKGVQIWDDEEGVASEHLPSDDLLVPEGTKVSLCNFDQISVKRRYSLHELWKKLQSGGAEDRGWSKKAVLNAMRYSRAEWTKKYTTAEDYAKAISDGSITPGAHMKEYVDTYTLYIKEFTGKGKISRYTILRDYAPSLSLTRNTNSHSEDKKKEIINEEGFLFKTVSKYDSIGDVLSTFMDCAGSGKWHRIPSLAEKVFVQCRQYDFTMNAIMDAVKVNMSLMLQASSGDAAEKIKELVFGPYTIIPSDVPFVQQRFALPTQEATGALQFMMLDMFRGIGEYRISEQANNGPQTATQRKLDAAESAKLSGTQLKRFNGQHTIYSRKFYKRLVELKEGERDYEMLRKFKDYLEEANVPKEAWQNENIESIQSNMLAGAGSPSYKLMAAEKTIELTNISPKDEGQRKAVEDALAALHGRANVSRYIHQTVPEPTFNEQKAGWENEMLSNAFANPADVRVMPDDNHVHHVAAHLGDMQRTIALVNEKIKTGEISEYVIQCAGHRLLNQGAHLMAHFEFLKKDKTKAEMLKQASRELSVIQGQADEIAKNYKAMQEQKEAAFDPMKDPDVMKDTARFQLQLDHQTKMNDLARGAQSVKHQQRLEQDADAAAQKLAEKRIESQTKSAKPKKEAKETK